MILYKKIILSLLFVIVGLLPACYLCNCPDIDNDFFDIFDLEVIATNSDYTAIIADERIAFQDLQFINLDYQVDYVAELTPSCNHGRWLNAAWACSCDVEGSSGAKSERMIDLTITTLNDYTLEYPAGSVLNDLIYPANYGDSYSLDEYVDDFRERLIPNESLKLSLLHRPSENPELHLRVRLELSNGEVYEADSVPFEVY